MKIKAIVSICKKAKAFRLFDNCEENGLQWLGDGNAVYPLLKMPPLNEKNLFAVFDIPEKQQNKMYVTNDALPENIDFRDAVECENILTPGEMDIGYAGRVLRPLHTSQGLTFIDTKYLDPLTDYEDMLELYERTDRSGNLYIAVKSGFMLVAVILPFYAIKERFITQLRTFTRDCETAYEIQQERERQGGNV